VPRCYTPNDAGFERSGKISAKHEEKWPTLGVIRAQKCRRVVVD